MYKGNKYKINFFTFSLFISRLCCFLSLFLFLVIALSFYVHCVCVSFYVSVCFLSVIFLFSFASSLLPFQFFFLYVHVLSLCLCGREWVCRCVCLPGLLSSRTPQTITLLSFKMVGYKNIVSLLAFLKK